MPEQTRQAAPFGDIGLNDLQYVIAERLREAGTACDILAGRERHVGCLAQRLPFLPRTVGAHRLFQPGKIEFAESPGATSSACSIDQP